MKPKILKFSTIALLLFLFFTAGCEKDDWELADENIVVDNNPWLSVYKTKNDYLNYIAVDLDTLGNIISSPDYTYRSGQVGRYVNGDVYFKHRYLLKSGYVVAYLYNNYVFTNITLKEYIEYNEENGIAGWSDELIYPRIIDTDPFVEFYHSSCLHCPNTQTFTLGEINEMIESGTMETVFEKLK